MQAYNLGTLTTSAFSHHNFVEWKKKPTTKVRLFIYHRYPLALATFKTCGLQVPEFHILLAAELWELEVHKS